MDDILDWLDGLGLSKYSALFAEHEIGLDILTDLTEDDFRELKIPLGDRKRLIRALAHFASSSETIIEPYAKPHASREAERRQLTIMFCDLVGSTELSTRLDPEDLREVISTYQDVCSKVIQQYNGYIAKYMGDGILVYFGYPQAHENDPERAVHTGLDIVEAIAGIGRGDVVGDVELAVRIGIATGLVVVGDLIGEGASEEANVIGETPNLAARLQALAKPNEVIVGSLTHELAGSEFVCECTGEHRLKGINEPETVWRVLHRNKFEDKSETEYVGSGSPLVGRQEELGLLTRSWQASTEGHGQAVLIQGEAGIGKSRLLDALREYAATEDHVWVAIRCSPYHTNSTLYPVIEHMKRVVGWTEDDTVDSKFAKLESSLKRQSLPLEEAIPLYAELMSFTLPNERYAGPKLSARQKREQTLDALVLWLLDEAERTPALQVWEDLHWADPTTLELLALYIDQSPTVSIMNVLTYRPEFVPPWPMRSHMTPITLNRLERPAVEILVRHLTGGKAVPGEVLEHIVIKADGVPLYVEELTKSVLESGYLEEESDRYTLTGSLSDVAIPATLQDTLMARLDRLPIAREVAQLGAVLGREFAYEMLSAVSKLKEDELHAGLGQLVEDELLYQRGRWPRSKYIFKHALIQDAAYHSLLKRARQRYHKSVARLLEQQHLETADAHPELLAHHYTEAGDLEQAINYWRTAGEQARTKSANQEAIAYLTRGLDLLMKMPDTEERARLELAFQASLGHASIVSKGHGSAEAERAYTRALSLCKQLSDAPELDLILFGLWRFYVTARSLDETHDVAVELRRLAHDKKDPVLQVVSCYAHGYTELCMGKLTDARDQFEDGIKRYQSTQRKAEIYRTGQNPGVACRGYLAMAEWLLGFPERAETRMRESWELATDLNDPFSLAYALCFTGTIVTEMCGGDVLQVVNKGLDIAIESGFSLWIAFANVQHDAAHFMQHPTDPELNKLQTSVNAIPQMGVHINTPYFMTMLAKAFHQVGKIDKGLQALDDAQRSINARSERWWEPEVHRLRGELLQSDTSSKSKDVQTCIEQAIDIARSQESKSLELRGAMSLARLWQKQAKSKKARSLLSDCYAQFTEGFDTADLVAAKALIDQLQ